MYCLVHQCACCGGSQKCRALEFFGCSEFNPRFFLVPFPFAGIEGRRREEERREDIWGGESRAGVESRRRRRMGWIEIIFMKLIL